MDISAADAWQAGAVQAYARGSDGTTSTDSRMCLFVVRSLPVAPSLAASRSSRSTAVGAVLYLHNENEESGRRAPPERQPCAPLQHGFPGARGGGLLSEQAADYACGLTLLVAKKALYKPVLAGVLSLIMEEGKRSCRA